MVATCALINKVLLKFHTDLLRFLLLFHGLTNFFFFLMFYLPCHLFQCCRELSSPGQQDCHGWGWCALKRAWKTSRKDM